MLKVKQHTIQIEVHPPKRISDTIGISDAFTRSVEFKTRGVTDTIGISDTFEAHRYTNYLNAIDDPYAEPIRIIKIEFSGLTLYLCDRLWGNAGAECVYEDRLYEPMVLSWGQIKIGEIHPVSYKNTPGQMSFTIDNDTPVGGAARFSLLFGTYTPQYTSIEVREFLWFRGKATDAQTTFKGHIEDIAGISSDQVTVTCSSFELYVANKFSHEILDSTNYPSADPDDYGKMLPQVYGQAKKAPFLNANNSVNGVFIIGHAVKAINAVYYYDTSTQEHISIGSYTAYTGNVGDVYGSYTGKAVIVPNSPPGGKVSADMDGFRDDSAGSYTGTAYALIEQPDHILKHVFMNRCGLALGQIDQVAYAAAAVFYAARSYTQAIVIDQVPVVRDLINQIAKQAKSIEFWQIGRHVIKYIPHSETTDKTLDGNRIDLDTISVTYTDRVDIKNQLTANYNIEWSGHPKEDAFLAAISVSGEDSVDSYGALEGQAHSLDFVTASAQAVDVIDWALGDQEEPRKVIELTGGFYLTDVIRGDVIAFDMSSGEL